PYSLSLHDALPIYSLEYRAANPDRGDRRAHRHRPGGLAERPPRHEAERAPGDAGPHRARPGGGIVDEAVDRHPRARSDGEGGAVEKEYLELALRSGPNLVVQHHPLAEHGGTDPVRPRAPDLDLV